MKQKTNQYNNRKDRYMHHPENPAHFIFHLPHTFSNRILRRLARKYHIRYSTKKKTLPVLQSQADKQTLLEKEKRVHSNDECAICFEPLQIDSIAITRCKHAFCSKCIFHYVSHHSSCCPMCRAAYTTAMMLEDKMATAPFEFFQFSRTDEFLDFDTERNLREIFIQYSRRIRIYRCNRFLHGIFCVFVMYICIAIQLDIYQQSLQFIESPVPNTYWPVYTNFEDISNYSVCFPDSSFVWGNAND